MEEGEIGVVRPYIFPASINIEILRPRARVNNHLRFEFSYELFVVEVLHLLGQPHIYQLTLMHLMESLAFEIESL